MDNFFYNLNDKLNAIRATPEVTHGQLNERDMSRAAKGYEKYGKEGMQALAKAGREGKALDPVRAKYDKYDDKPVDEGMGDVVKKIGGMAKKVGGAVLNKLGHGSDEDMRKDLQRKMGMPQTGKKPEQKTTEAAKYRDPKYKDKLYTQEPPDYTYGPDMDDAYYNPKPDDYAGRKRKIGGSEFDHNDPLRKGDGIGRSGIKNNILDRGPRKGLPSRDQVTSLKGSIKSAKGTHAEPNLPEAGAPMTAKQKSFAALAEPKDKITFADKIAGAKKEVDEMLGDVAAEAMKSALSGGQKKLDKNNNGRLDANDFAMLRKGGKKEVADEGWDDMIKDTERRRTAPKIGSITHGSKHDVEEIPGGRRVTRRVDPNTGHSVGTDDDGPADGEKRGRGRPKGTKGAIGAKGPSGRSKLMTKEGDNESDDIKQAMAMLKKAGYTVTKAADRAEDLEEKAVSKKQQKFMGMVHATQKGERPASGAVGKVAKTMKKGDAEDFASTKHKGLPEKKKPEAKKDDAPKKKEKTEEQGGTGTPTASSGFSYGKGIYDSLNRELEGMISEGMNINMSMNSDANGGPSKSLTVTATDEDAIKLSQLLKSAGLGSSDDQGYGGSGYQSACGCGTPDCSCGDQEMDEAYGDNAVSQNAPDYPTNTETAEDNFEYAGGLNKPKSTGQSTVPVLASQEERQESYAAEEEDAIKRMMEMAGVKKKEVDEEKTEEGNLFTGNLAKARADGKKEADLDGDGKMEKVDEGILASTANLWKTYKGQYGV